MYNLKPFVKWAGGKTQLLSELVKRIPSDKHVYMEPFVGGGALFLNQLNNTQFHEYIINDKNPYIYTLYECLKHSEEHLIKCLIDLEQEYLSKHGDVQKEYYIKLRKEFNDNKINNIVIRVDDIAKFVILNKTCFNGLYRENKKSEFNVPWGGDKHTLNIDYDGMKKFHEIMKTKHNSVFHLDFMDTMGAITKNTFVYLDPPYRPINETSNFNTYTSNGFNDNNQRDLKNYCDYINQIGGKFLLSNSDCPDGFFDELYKGYKIERVEARRNINSKGDKRGKITELLISNY